ncbi:MAG: DUF6067 family protein [Tannerella sp.]|nr:DUF6067 family protein [Tannerella sp.]
MMFFAVCLLTGCNFAEHPNGESQYQSFAPDGIPFVVADSSWDVDGRGNHRTVVSVKQSKHDAVKATLPWRRPDMRPETKNVKATAYVRPGKTLIAIGNFDAEDRFVRLSFDWDRLGIDPSKAVLRAPAVKNFQDEQTFDANASISVKSKKGWLLILSQN